MLTFSVLDVPTRGVGKQFLILGECWAIANIAHYLEKVENTLNSWCDCTRSWKEHCV